MFNSLDLGVIFLLILSLIWIIFATIQDLKKREVANWLNFSLIIFALGFRFFYSLFYGLDSGEGFTFFYQGVIGFLIFLVLGNLFYYSRIFAGGDAKLFIALGAVIPMNLLFLDNLVSYLSFLFIFLVSGAVYGLIWAFALVIIHFKPFKKRMKFYCKENIKILLISLVIGFSFVCLIWVNVLFIFLGVVFIFIPFLYFASKSLEDCCMVKKVSVKLLTEGDWLYEDVKIGKKIIRASWDGLSKKDVALLRKYKKTVLLKQGIPFVPVFLISFLVWLFMEFSEESLFSLLASRLV